jgi:hypothetical protein
MVYSDVALIHTPVASGSAPAGWGLQVRDDLEWLARPILARVRRTANQSIPNATPTAVVWDTQDEDTSPLGDLWVPGGTAGQFTLPVAGVWEFKMGSQFAINATGARLFYFAYLARVLGVKHDIGNAAWYVGGTVSAEARFPAGAVVVPTVYQASGGALNLDMVYETWASARFVSL